MGGWIEFTQCETDEGTTVQCAMEGMVQLLEEGLNGVSTSDLVIKNTTEHHNRDSGFHRVAGNIG